MAIQYIQNGSLTQAQKNEIITSAVTQSVTQVNGEGYVKKSSLVTVNSQSLIGDRNIDISGTTTQYLFRYKVDNGQTAGPNSGETWETNVTVISNTVSGNDGLIILDSSANGTPQLLFSRKGNVIDIEIPNYLKYLGYYAFRGTGIRKIIIPDNIIGWDRNVFATCSNLEYVTFGSGVTDTGLETFLGCTNLTGITWGSSIIEIKKGCFQNCTSLARLTIPSHITSIINNAFSGCTSLSLTMESTTPCNIGSNVFDGVQHIYVPAASVDTYKAATNWSNYASIIEAIPE